MKRYFKGVLLVLSLILLSGIGSAATRGDVVFTENYDGPTDPSLTYTYANPVYKHREMSSNGTYALWVSRPSALGMGNATLLITLPVNSMKGCRVRFEAQIKADGVAQPINGGSGVKFMVSSNGTSGGNAQPAVMYGTFDWKTVSQNISIPSDATQATLMVGLEQSMGVAWYDNIKLTIARPKRVRPVTPVTGTIYTGHPTVPRLRGAMVNNGLGSNSANAQVLGTQWNANLARFPFIGAPTDLTNQAGIDSWLTAQYAKLDAFLPQAQTNKMMVVIDLHSPPGGNDSTTGGLAIFSSQAKQDKLVQIWQAIADRYKNNTVIWGYDLLNEPQEGTMPLNLDGWNEVATRLGQEIRLIDTNHAIIVESDPSLGFDYLTPLSGVSGVVYSPHIYTTLAYTHQGVLAGYPEGVALPSSPTLTVSLQAVRDFQTDYNVQIYVGEFAAVRWAPNAATWYTSMMDLFESYNWDWSYHAYREWDGWDLEYPSSHSLTPYPTNSDRLIAVKAKLSLNQKPW